MKRMFPLLTCLILLWACATEGPAVKVKSQHGTMNDSGDITSDREPSAEELLDEAATMLISANGVADNNREARKLLNRLILLYPDSKWRTPAEALILLIDQRKTCTDKIKKSHAGCEELLSQKLKCEESENQCRQELIRILHENEQLKKDLQNLKNLEIELEKRNRKLR